MISGGEGLVLFTNIGLPGITGLPGMASPCSTLSVENCCGVIFGGDGTPPAKSNARTIGPVNVAVVDISTLRISGGDGINTANPGGMICGGEGDQGQRDDHENYGYFQLSFPVTTAVEQL